MLTWWGGVILTAELLFAGLDGVQDAAGTTYAITSLDELRAVAGWQDLLLNLYFSVTTFSTIMDGGLAPAGNGTRAVVAIESITGALLVALLVFVLGDGSHGKILNQPSVDAIEPPLTFSAKVNSVTSTITFALRTLSGPLFQDAGLSETPLGVAGNSAGCGDDRVDSVPNCSRRQHRE